MDEDAALVGGVGEGHDAEDVEGGDEDASDCCCGFLFGLGGFGTDEEDGGG